MRIETNTRLVKRNRKVATYLFFATLLVLIGSFVLINVPLFMEEMPLPLSLLVLVQTLSLPLALVMTLLSVRYTNLWARVPRPEKAIPENLKGMSKNSVLYNYFHFPARHVLIAPQGVYAIVTRWHTGKYAVEGEQWRSKQGALSRLLSGLRWDGLGDPTRDAKLAMLYVKKQLEDIAPEVEVKPLIVFVDPKVDVEMDEPAVPVVYADTKRKPSLTGYLQEEKRREQAGNALPLTDAQLKAFEAKTLPKRELAEAGEAGEA